MRVFIAGCKFFRIFFILTGVIASAGFLYTAIVDVEFARKGGLWMVPVPLVLAIGANYLFGALARWADRPVNR